MVQGHLNPNPKRVVCRILDHCWAVFLKKTVSWLWCQTLPVIGSLSLKWTLLEERDEAKWFLLLYTCISRVYILVKTKVCWWYGIVPSLLQVVNKFQYGKEFLISGFHVFYCFFVCGFFQWTLKTSLYNSMNKNVFNWYSLSVLMSPAAWSRWILLMLY